jgi:hypothetical protein
MHPKNSPHHSGVLRILAVITALVLSSCSASRMERVVSPPATPPLSRSIGYAVIVSSYVQVRDTPSSDGVSLGYYRRGTVIPIEERRTVRGEAAGQDWLLNGGAERGWVPASDVRLYDNEAKARTAAQGLNK